MSKQAANIEGKIVCAKCGHQNDPNAKECVKCKSKKFAPYFVVAKRPINRQVSVEITTSNPQYGDVRKRITLSKWWLGDNASFNIPTLKQWRAIKRIIDTDLSPLLGWETEKDHEPETQPPDIQELDLSDKDIKSLLKLLPTLQKYDLKNTIDLKRLIAGRRVFHYMRLEKVLKEFEKRLKTKANEPEWQAFFKKNLLILNPGYMKLIEKPNISLDIKFPDFILINIEGYADLYEIKTPSTPLLAYDRSHKNYYWSSELSKALSQVENYVDSVNKNSAGLEKLIELKIMHPRGYIIAGHSSQLKEPKKNDNFRLLNESLKSTEVLTYDSFLERFKRFSKTLKESA